MTRSTTAAKPATKKTTSRAKASTTSAPKTKPVVVQENPPVVSAPDMRKVELIEAAVERAGVRKKFAKPAIEAALAILGEALDEGRDLNMRPLGKVKIQRSKKVANGTVIQARIRRPEAKPKTPDEGLADAAE